MNGGDLNAARVIGGALRLFRRPTGGGVWQQGKQLGSGDDLRQESSWLFLGRPQVGRANQHGRQGDKSGDDFHSGFRQSGLYSIDFNEAVCQDDLCWSDSESFREQAPNGFASGRRRISV